MSADLEKTYPVKKCHIGHLVKEAQGDNAHDIGWQEVIGKTNMNHNRRDQCEHTVTDVGIKTEGSSISIGTIEDGVGAPYS